MLNPKTLVHKRSRSSQILAAILVNSVYEMRNYPIVLLNTVLSPLSFLLVIVFVSHGSLIGEAVEGGFIMSMFSAGVALQADLSHLKNDFKLQDMVVSSPTNWMTYMFGMALSEIVYSLPALVVLGVLAYYFMRAQRHWHLGAHRGPSLDVHGLSRDRFHAFNILIRHSPELRVFKADFDALLDHTACLLSDHLHSASIQIPSLPVSDHLRG